MKYQMLLGLTGLAAVQAHPKVAREPNANTNVAKRGVDISKYSLPSSLSSYTRASSVKTADLKASSSGKDYVEVAKALVKEKFPDQEFRAVKDNYVGSNGIGHVYFKQQVHGLDIDNADLVVNVSFWPSLPFQPFHTQWSLTYSVCATRSSMARSSPTAAVPSLARPPRILP